MARPGGVWAQKKFRDALQVAVNEDTPEGIKKLRAIAVKLVDKAVEGEGWAIQQVADRLDGKPPQDLSVNGGLSDDLASLSDAELSTRIKHELAILAGRGGKETGPEKLH